MKKNPAHRIDKATAEQLLSGDFDAHPQLGELLASVRPTGGEPLPDEWRAVAAFRQADLASVPHRTPRRLEVVRKSLATSVTAKLVAVAAVVLVATGGAALAAGKLPTPGKGHGNEHKPVKTHSASPSPNLAGLCHAYQAGALEQGKASENPAFTALSTAAGGEENLDAFCAELLGTPASQDGEEPGDDQSEGAAHGKAHKPEHPVKPSQAAEPTHPAQAHGPRADHPGNHGTSHHGKPDQPGKPDHPGNRHHGKPDNTGKPDNPGKASNPGKTG